MKYLDLTLPTPEANLACDEALLDLCESGSGTEILRIWEPATAFVVLGYANRIATEVNMAFCQQNQIPILRRCTGGGTVLQGPGCLNYSLILRIEEAGPLSTVTSTNRQVMNKQQGLFSALLNREVQVRGDTDLALGDRKFSGNAQRRRRHFLLFHGSILLDCDLALIERALPLPSKEPRYRERRAHVGFLTNLNISAPQVKRAFQEAWNARDTLRDVPWNSIEQLAKDKYSLDAWTRLS